MKSTKYPISNFASNEMLNFANYTIASRAIPSLVDSLKPAQRFFLYSTIQSASKTFKKVSAISGIVSEYGYNHGETSCAGAGQLMAATWKNNICLVEGRGSFGTRQVQEAGAPRYVYVSLHENFKKYVKDLDLSPEHSDPEHLPPKYYLPVLPIVAVNGASGIATGFATNILPRSEDDVVAAIRELLSTGKITTDIKVSFPDFKGTTDYDASIDRYVCKGVWRKVGKTTLIIEEIPYGFDREGYVKVLDDLESEGLIVGYEDKTGTQGFVFDVKLKQQTSAKWSDKQIASKFKLTKNHSENITVIGPKNELLEYDDIRDLIKDFVDFRMTTLSDRITYETAETAEHLRWLQVKIQFIEAVLDDKILFKGKSRKQVEEQILKETDALDLDTSRLLSLNIMTLTKEQVQSAKKDIAEAKKDLKYWKATTPQKQFVEDLDELYS